MRSNYTDKADLAKVQETEKFYTSFVAYTKALFADIKANKPLNSKAIGIRVKMALSAVRHYRRFVLSIHHHAGHESDGDYLISHTVRSTVTAIVLGTSFDLSEKELIELGMAALLQDIGMLSLPTELYLNDRVLTDEEKHLLNDHPLFGYKILKGFGFPLAVSAAVLEHHEREDGSGYPRNLKGADISQYGKIIAVACSYEALSAQRMYKKAKNRHAGLIELLKNKGKRYDDAVVKALVSSFSIYPIGLFVLLSDGRKAQIVKVNPEYPLFPTVKLLGPAHAERTVTIDTRYNAAFIIRSLTPEEVTE